MDVLSLAWQRAGEHGALRGHLGRNQEGIAVVLVSKSWLALVCCPLLLRLLQDMVWCWGRSWVIWCDAYRRVFLPQRPWCRCWSELWVCAHI